MKCQLIVAALLIASAIAQGYVVGGSSGLSLPTIPKSGSDSGSISVTTTTVSVPNFPTADLARLNGGSTNSAATAANIANAINGAKT